MNEIQLKRGSQDAVDGYTGPAGEIVADAQNWNMRLQDGRTAGGITVGANLFKISPPELASPLDGSEISTIYPVLISGPYSGDGVHTATYWQVARDPEFTDLVVDSGWLNEQLTQYSLEVNGHQLERLETYYVRIQHRSSEAGDSGWGRSTIVSTDWTLPLRPIKAMNQLDPKNKVGPGGAIANKNYTLAAVSYEVDSASDVYSLSDRINIYRMVDGIWQLEAELDAPNETSFRTSIMKPVSFSSDDNRLICKDHYADLGGITGAGALYVYDYSPADGWVLTEELRHAPPPDSRDELGSHASASSDCNVLAAFTRNRDNGKKNGGGAFIFEEGPDGWVRTELIPSEIYEGGRFGSGITLSSSGNTAFVGTASDAYGRGEGYPDRRLYVFEREALGEWVQVAIVSEPETMHAFMGITVSDDGSTLITHAQSYYSELSAPVMVYGWAGGAWVRHETIALSEIGAPVTRVVDVDLTAGGNLALLHATVEGDDYRLSAFIGNAGDGWSLIDTVSSEPSGTGESILFSAISDDGYRALVGETVALGDEPHNRLLEYGQ